MKKNHFVQPRKMVVCTAKPKEKAMTMTCETKCCLNCQYWAGATIQARGLDGEVRANLMYGQCLAVGEDDKTPFAFQVTGAIPHGQGAEEPALVFTLADHRCAGFWRSMASEADILDLSGMEIPPAVAGLDCPGSFGGRI